MILNRQRRVRVAISPLEAFLRSAQRQLGIARAEVSVCFITRAEMAKLNRAYRKKIGPTDVLSFSAQEPATKAQPGARRYSRAQRRAIRFLGDIAISPEEARKYAKRNHRSFPDELRVLILHGILHLLGYDHETDEGEMDRLEERLRRRLGLE
jgi:probable rRNA maturation factor